MGGSDSMLYIFYVLPLVALVICCIAVYKFWKPKSISFDFVSEKQGKFADMPFYITDFVGQWKSLKTGKLVDVGEHKIVFEGTGLGKFHHFTQKSRHITIPGTEGTEPKQGVIRFDCQHIDWNDGDTWRRTDNTHFSTLAAELDDTEISEFDETDFNLEEGGEAITIEERGNKRFMNKSRISKGNTYTFEDEAAVRTEAEFTEPASTMKDSEKIVASDVIYSDDFTGLDTLFESSKSRHVF